MKEESDAGFDSRRDMGARTSGPPPCKRGKVASASPDARLDTARPGSDSCARSPKRCTYEFCERPEESTKFYQIYDFRVLEGRTGAPSWGTPCARSTTLGSRNGASWKEKAKSDATLNQLPLLFLLLHEDHHLCASLMHPSTLILCNPQSDSRMVVA
jgi:hypothetical protein